MTGMRKPDGGGPLSDPPPFLSALSSLPPS